MFDKKIKNLIFILISSLVVSCGLSDADKRLMEKVDGIYFVYVESTDPWEVAKTQKGLGPYYNHFITYKLLIDGTCEMISATDSTDIKNTGTWTCSSNTDGRTIKMEWPNNSMIMTGWGPDYEMEGTSSGFIRHEREFFDKYLE